MPEGNSFDIAIVGGGLAGASLAVALAPLPLTIALIEPFAPDSSAQPSFDERTTALGNASRRVFEALGVWPALAQDAAPITAIHVSDAGRYGFARVEAQSLGQDALRYVVPNRVLGRGLWSALGQHPRITALMPARVSGLQVDARSAALSIEAQGQAAQTVHAKLVVAADGVNSMVRTASALGATVNEYDQVAVVAALRTDLPVDGVAYERFTVAGPMALLPLRTSESGWRTLVWAARPDDATRLMQLSAADFMAEWQQAFGWRAGRAIQLGTRGRYPLALSQSTGTIAPRVALLGNAAQSLHPVAGQGFNLALRDVADLAEVLAEGAGQTDPGAPDVLASYAARRTQDRGGVIGFTDTLVRVFGSAHPVVATARDAGLLLFDLLPPAKRALARVSLGFGARSPRLARGLALEPLR